MYCVCIYIYIITYAMYIVHCVHCTLYNNSIMYTVHCTLYIIKCIYICTIVLQYYNTL